MSDSRAIDQLIRRIEALRNSDVASFGETFSRFMQFLRSSDSFAPIVTAALEKHPEAESLFRSYCQDSDPNRLPDLSPEQRSAVAIVGLSALNDVSSIRQHWSAKYGRLSGKRAEGHNQFENDAGALKLAKDVFLEPLYDFLIESVEAAAKQPASQKHSNQNNEGFSTEEKGKITELLDALKENLLKAAANSARPQSELKRLENIVSQEFDDLKERSETLSKKDWKNAFLNAIVSLIFLFAFSSEARSTLHSSYVLLANMVYNQSVDPNEIPPVEEHFMLDQNLAGEVGE